MSALVPSAVGPVGGSVTLAHQLARPEVAAAAAGPSTESLQYSSLLGGAVGVLVDDLVSAPIARGTGIARQARR
jgi:hypothetical protein